MSAVQHGLPSDRGDGTSSVTVTQGVVDCSRGSGIPIGAVSRFYFTFRSARAVRANLSSMCNGSDERRSPRCPPPSPCVRADRGPGLVAGIRARVAAPRSGGSGTRPSRGLDFIQRRHVHAPQAALAARPSG